MDFWDQLGIILTVIILMYILYRVHALGPR